MTIAILITYGVPAGLGLIILGLLLWPRSTQESDSYDDTTSVGNGYGHRRF